MALTDLAAASVDRELIDSIKLMKRFMSAIEESEEYHLLVARFRHVRLLRLVKLKFDASTNTFMPVARAPWRRKADRHHSRRSSKQRLSLLWQRRASRGRCD